ncbi:MAG: hypothetical protein ACI8WB_000162 [Phenylobacterium sp.]|jgi:hypothetical protein
MAMNGQQKADVNVAAFEKWIASMSDDDFQQIVFRGQLNRGEISKGVNCAKSALRQNPRMADMLATLEDDLRNRGVLAELANQTDTDKPIKYDQEATKRTINANKAAKLEEENLALKAKVNALEEQLSRFTELSEALSEYGVMPR